MEQTIYPVLKENDTLHIDFMKAIDENNYDKVHSLIKQGADVNILNGRPIINACSNGNYDIVKLLIDNGANINVRLISCVIHGQNNDSGIDIVKLLIDKGVNLNEYENYPRGDAIQSPLFVASMHNNIKMVNFLLENGANVHAQEDEALITASWYGHNSIIKILLENGADINARNGKPLASAIEEKTSKTKTKSEITKQQYETFELLLEKGANVYDKALIVACTDGHLFIVDKLLKLGANINISKSCTYIDHSTKNEEYDNKNPLIRSIINNHYDIVELLLKNGADPEIDNGAPLKISQSLKYDDIIELLLNAMHK